MTTALGPQKRRRKGAERREEILNAALEVCLEEGVAALRTEKIARRVGLSSGGIFRHFSSKKVILSALAERLCARLEATLPAFPAEEDPLSWLHQFVEARSRALLQDAGLGLLFSREFEKALPQEAKRALRSQFSKTWEALLGAVRAAQSQGIARQDLEAEELAMAITALVQCVLWPALTRDYNHDPEKVWRAALDLLTRPCPEEG